MSESMPEMNNAMRQKLNMQSQEMGISKKDRQVKYDSTNREYYIEGWKEHTDKGLKQAVDDSLKGKIADRNKRMNDAIDGKSG
jgi:hypothetical protein